jgi:hypothetical protein
MKSHSLAPLAMICSVALASHGIPTGVEPPPKAIQVGGSLATQRTPGSYELSFFDSRLQPVSCLVVNGPDLVLRAHVADQSGAPATTGRITFQYCSLQGLPPNDINRPDEAPSSACDLDHTGKWADLRSDPVDPSGDALFDFGLVKIPRTVGFRFRYSSQGGSIASGTSASEDFTWKTDCSVH